jgi:hypothetical protein
MIFGSFSCPVDARALQLSMLFRTTNFIYFGLVRSQACQAALREQGQYDSGYAAMILQNLHAISVPNTDGDIPCRIAGSFAMLTAMDA